MVTDKASRLVSDPATTAHRIEKLRRYLTANVLAPSGACVCRSLDQCRRSALRHPAGAPRPNAAFAAGQLSHVGHHYDLRIGDRPLRILVIAMETGRPRESVNLDERRAEVMASAALAFPSRNPHMRGVASALRLAVGRNPGPDRDGELLRLPTPPRSVHLFDAFAMANLRLCSATVAGSTKSLGNSTMSRNCLPHLSATVRILEPTLCIVQGAEVCSSLTEVMRNRHRLGSHLERARIAGVDTLVAAFTHPSAMRLIHHWGRLTSAPYLHGTVVPTLRAAYQIHRVG
ncbi:hypothetical protein [Verrucosispora sp. ts21]|uniref:hypothetical protein n=1 Tax=Verrucosispora sp. ts21 TaxID=2069341 RepID=UPI0011AF74F1|nr:hypothetical protein [Verrucosispora sp. ts21]